MDRIEAPETWRIDKQRQQNTKSVFDFAPRLYGKCGWNLCTSQVCKEFFLYFITRESKQQIYNSHFCSFFTLCVNIFFNHIFDNHISI